MLKLRFLKELFPFTAGVDDDNIYFCYVFSNFKEKVNKGLYIPFGNSINSELLLKEAINHGAIATLWQKDTPIPKYKPNQFPAFFVEDLSLAVKTLIEKYNDYVIHNHINTNKTSFMLSSPLLSDSEKNRLKKEELGELHMFKVESESFKGGER